MADTRVTHDNYTNLDSPESSLLSLFWQHNQERKSLRKKNHYLEKVHLFYDRKKARKSEGIFEKYKEHKVRRSEIVKKNSCSETNTIL